MPAGGASRQLETSAVVAVHCFIAVPALLQRFWWLLL
jgi:hypothetical protein